MLLKCEDGKMTPVRILCCPEDVTRSDKCKHNTHELCGFCEIPICKSCRNDAWSPVSNYRMPMALSNDNFWGYTTDIITRFQVRWIEAAIVTPCWTNMLVYYVEGDRGHLMNEIQGKQSFRTVVRGSCISYPMPWEDVLESLEQNLVDRDLLQVPHPEKCVKYMLRVLLRVNGFDFKKHLKQVMVRPCVLVELLDFLILKNHEVFRGKGSAKDLRERMRKAVERQYPETEAHKPLSERVGHIPPGVEALLRDSQNISTEEVTPGFNGSKRHKILTDKNATPGDGARSVEKCLDDLRPFAICVDKSAGASSNPATMREGALGKYGELRIQAAGKEINQFRPTLPLT